MHSGGFSSLLKGWLHKAGVQGQQKLKNVCDLHTLKLAKNSENIMFIVAHNMGKMKQLLLSNPKSSRGMGGSRPQSPMENPPTMHINCNNYYMPIPFS